VGYRDQPTGELMSDLLRIWLELGCGVSHNAVSGQFPSAQRQTCHNPTNPFHNVPDAAKSMEHYNNYVLMATYKGVPTKIFSLSGFVIEKSLAGVGPYAKRFATNSNSCDGPFAPVVAT
jgi:hypothetical protein